MISAASLGEGFHNYHHVFPWDYKTAELGKYSFNWTTALLDFFAKIGRYSSLFNKILKIVFIVFLLH